MITYDDVDWSQANCAGTDADMFYYNAHEDDMRIESDVITDNNPYSQVYAYLSVVCNNCMIKNQCFEYALFNEEHGYWGGSSPADRREARTTLGITLNESYNPDKYDEYVLQLRREQDELLQEEDYGIYI